MSNIKWKRDSDGETFDTANILTEVYDETNKRIKTDATLNASNIDIGNVQVYSTDGSDSGTLYGKADASGNVYSIISDGTDELEVNSDGSINIGDISAGTQTNDIKVTLDSETVEVVQDTAGDLNMTEANSGDILTSVQLIDDTVGTIDTAFSGKVTVTGGKAEETVPTEVADADAVATWFDTFGRQVLKGTNLGLNAMDTNEVSPALLLTNEQTLLDAVTATGASSSYNVLNYNKITFYYIASSTSTGATIKIQSSPDDSNWYDEDTEAISADGTTQFTIDGKRKYVRANVTSRTDGTYSVKMVAGN